MGRLQAEEFANRVPLKRAITWHLRSNHYPPHPYEMIPVAIRAIKKVRQGDIHGKVKCPYPHVKYGKLVPAWAIISALHLDAWVEDYADDYDE